MASILDMGMSDWTDQLADAREGLLRRGIEALLKKNLKAAFAAVPHEWKIEDEKEAKRYFLLFMKLIGADISGERQSARKGGRGSAGQDGNVCLRVQVREDAARGARPGEDEGIRQPVARYVAPRLLRRRQLRPREARHRRSARRAGVTP